MITMKKITKLAILLIALTLLMSLCSCTAKEQPQNTNTAGETQEETTVTEETQAATVWKTALYREDTELGEGNLTVKVKVKADEKSITFTLHTDKTNLAEILLEQKLVEGEDGAYGLYIKKVNGILADYDVDQTFWSLEQNGETLMTGVSGVTISGGEQYELVRAK